MELLSHSVGVALKTSVRNYSGTISFPFWPTLIFQGAVVASDGQYRPQWIVTLGEYTAVCHQLGRMMGVWFLRQIEFL